MKRAETKDTLGFKYAHYDNKLQYEKNRKLDQCEGLY